MNASFSPEVVEIIRNKILAIIEKVLLIKFPFIRDLSIGNNPFYIFFILTTSCEKMIPQTKELIVQYEIT